MELNDFYDQINGFWNRVLPILLLHFFAYLMYFKVIGLKFSLKDRIEKYSQTDNYKRTKRILEEFSLWTKIPYFLIVGIIIYFVVLDDITDGIEDLFISPIELRYSETEIWDRQWKNNLAVINYYRDTTLNSGINGLHFYKNQKLEVYKNKYPDQYRSRINWISRDLVIVGKYYNLLIVFLIISFPLLIAYRRFTKQKLLKLIAGYILVIFITAPMLLFFRYKWERKIEKRINAENAFVAACLKIENEFNEEKLYKIIEESSESIEEELSFRNHQIPWLLKFID